MDLQILLLLRSMHVDRTIGKAYANTVKAHELLMVLNLEYDNGIRIDVANPDALGPFLTRDESLDEINNLLNTCLYRSNRECFRDLSVFYSPF